MMNSGKPQISGTPRNCAPLPSVSPSTKYFSMAAMAGWLEAKIMKPKMLMAKGSQ